MGARMDEQKQNELLVMHMSRQQQMRRKKERTAQERADDVYYAEELKKLNYKLRVEEAEQIRDKFERAKKRDAFLLTQMSQKLESKEIEKVNEMYEAEGIKQWIEDDDAIFNQYAQ